MMKIGTRAVWNLSAKGIYVLDPDSPNGAEVDFFPFSPARHSESLRLPGDPNPYVWGSGGLGVSPDGRWLLYEHRDRYEAVVMLVDGFR